MERERMVCMYVSQAKMVADVLGNINVIGEYTIDEVAELEKIRKYLKRAVKRQEDFQREAEEREALA